MQGKALEARFAPVPVAVYLGFGHNTKALVLMYFAKQKKQPTLARRDKPNSI